MPSCTALIANGLLRKNSDGRHWHGSCLQGSSCWPMGVEEFPGYLHSLLESHKADIIRPVAIGGDLLEVSLEVIPVALC
jgi:hypothetical protein